MSRGWILLWLALVGFFFGIGWALGRSAWEAPPGCGRMVQLLREPHPAPAEAAADLERMGVPAVQISDRTLLMAAEEAVLCEGSGHVVIVRPGTPAYFWIPSESRVRGPFRLWRWR
jgi:hypothetical protein